MTRRSGMVSIAMVGCVALAAGAAPAEARGHGHHAAAAGAVPGKPSKKQLEIEKHEWLAQYFVLRANDLDGAAREYQAILRLDKNNIQDGLALVDVYQRASKPKLAMGVLKTLGKKNPKAGEVWRALAQVQASAGDDKGMTASVGKALALNPGDGDAYWILFDRAEQRYRKGDAAAKPELADAAQKFMQTTSYRYGMAFKQAERTLVELSGAPLDLAVYDAKQAYADAFTEGMIGAINQKMGEAKQGFEKCTAEKPDDQECHYYLGLIYSSVKASDAYAPDKALAELALAKDLPEAWVETGKLLRTTDQNDDARKALGKALALNPNYAAAHLELGILDKLDGKSDAAVKELVAAIEVDRYAPVADRALGELAKVQPNHPLVTEGLMVGSFNGDIFSTDKFKGAVKMIEDQMGGVDEKAPEKQVIEDIVDRLRRGSDLSSKFVFHVAVLNTPMVNAFALPDGGVYVTRGLFDFLKKTWPKRPIDANNDVLAGVLGHELTHVIRRHTVETSIFQEAVKDASRDLDPAVLTHVTRIHEIEADREGIVMAFLAGYHPRGCIEFMEVSGKEMEIPQHLDHPTFEERVSYLEDYWTNDVKYAFVSFELGVKAMGQAGKLEATDLKAAVAQYDEAIDDFKRFQTTIKSNKQVLNDLGIAYTKLGVLGMAAADTPLGRWQTRFSLEHDSSIAYVGLVRDEKEEGGGGTRGAGGGKKRLPWQLKEAISMFKEALADDETYGKAALNLAAAELAAGKLDEATAALAKVKAGAGVAAAEVELLRGVILAEQKDYAKAKAAFDKALAAKSTKQAASYDAARCLALAGKGADAKTAYLAYAKAYPGGPWAKAATAAAGKL